MNEQLLQVCSPNDLSCQINVVATQVQTMHQMMTNHLQHHQALEISLTVALVGFVLNIIKDGIWRKPSR